MTAFLEVALEGGRRCCLDLRDITRVETSENSGPADVASSEKPLLIYLKSGDVVKGFGVSIAGVMLMLFEQGMVSRTYSLNEDEWSV